MQGKEERDVSVFDEVGYWTEIKLDIVRKYAAAYSTIMAAQPRLRHVYIDGFAGAGLNISRRTGELIPGSPLRVLQVAPFFTEYYFVDVDERKVDKLKELAGDRAGVHVLHGDCNELLPTTVFPQVRYEDYRRSFCLLDPYGLHLDWKVTEAAGKRGTIDLLLNFPIADMNRNVLRKDAQAIEPAQAERMNRYWGDGSWLEVAYAPVQTLFGPELAKTRNEAIAAAFVQRLKSAAGFSHVSRPLPMQNSQGAVVYYLLFAANKPVATKIMDDIFDKYRGREA